MKAARRRSTTFGAVEVEISAELEPEGMVVMLVVEDILTREFGCEVGLIGEHRLLVAVPTNFRRALCPSWWTTDGGKVAQVAMTFEGSVMAGKTALLNSVGWFLTHNFGCGVKWAGEHGLVFALGRSTRKRLGRVADGVMAEKIGQLCMRPFEGQFSETASKTECQS